MRKIERMIRNFVREIDPNVRVVFHDGDMESDGTKQTIYVNVDEFLYTYDDEQNHLQVMKENGLLIDILVPTYIILHEIGHVVNDRKYKYLNAMLMQYHYKVNELVKRYDGIELLRKYKQLKLEKDADEFAYKYYLHNYNFIKKFDDEIRAVL
jgi:hypothetical protein